jgi:hypothetical protein
MLPKMLVCPYCEEVLKLPDVDKVTPQRKIMCTMCENSFAVSDGLISSNSAALDALGLGDPVPPAAIQARSFEDHVPRAEVVVTTRELTNRVNREWKFPTRQTKKTPLLVILLGVLGFLIFVGSLVNDDQATVETSNDAYASEAQTPDSVMTIRSGNYFGCVAKADLSKIIRFATQKDEAAFTAAISQGLNDGTCTLFKHGEQVYLSNGEVFTGLMRIRRAGETTEYWTVIEAAR